MLYFIEKIITQERFLQIVVYCVKYRLDQFNNKFYQSYSFEHIKSVNYQESLYRSSLQLINLRFLSDLFIKKRIFPYI